MNLEKLEKLASLAEKYDYKPDEGHFNNLAAFVGVNSSLIADLCKEYTILQREMTNAQEALKSAGIEADTVQAGLMELVDKLRIKQNHIQLRDTYIEDLEQRAEAAEAKADNLNNGWLNAISERDDARAKLAAENALMLADYRDIPEMRRIGAPLTPATDACLNAVRAEGVDMVAEALIESGVCTSSHTVGYFKQFAAQLRAGNAGKDGGHE